MKIDINKSLNLKIELLSRAKTLFFTVQWDDEERDRGREREEQEGEKGREREKESEGDGEEERWCEGE